jgi:cell division protein FtsZ
MTTPLENQNDAVLKKNLTFKVIGVGGAGGNVVTQMAFEVPQGIELSIVNTDAQALKNSTVSEQLVLGAKLTRGLGAGGDPEMGRIAATEDSDKCKELCSNTDVLFIIAGLGGGTGTGASPVIAETAKQAGALVLAIVTTPFDFEGDRRKQQAQFGLKHLKAAADAVICVPNQQIFKLIDENTSARDAFKTANGLLIQGVRSIHRILTQTGLVNVDFADLCAVTRGRHSESTLAVASAVGANRAGVIIEKLLHHPLFEGNILTEADSVLVSVLGGEDMSMAEVSRIMTELSATCKNAHVIFGAAIDAAFDGQIEVTVIASRREHREETAEDESPENRPRTEGDIKPLFQEPAEGTRPASRYVSPAPSLSDEKKEEMLIRKKGVRRKNLSSMRQGQLPLEIVSKGRFEKSEPTIHQGQDLDVPTFVRKQTPLN